MQTSKPIGALRAFKQPPSRMKLLEVLVSTVTLLGRKLTVKKAYTRLPSYLRRPIYKRFRHGWVCELIVWTMFALSPLYEVRFISVFLGPEELFRERLRFFDIFGTYILESGSNTDITGKSCDWRKDWSFSSCGSHWFALAYLYSIYLCVSWSLFKIADFDF